MTTLVYSTRHRTMAADTMVSNGHTSGTVSKIAWHKKSGAITGITGPLCQGQQWLEIFKKYGLDHKRLWPNKILNENNMCIVVTKDGDVYVAESNGWCKFKSEFYAYGSGADFALGALAHGATPREAVEIASLFDTGGTNSFVEVFELPRKVK